MFHWTSHILYMLLVQAFHRCSKPIKLQFPFLLKECCCQCKWKICCTFSKQLYSDDFISENLCACKCKLWLNRINITKEAESRCSISFYLLWLPMELCANNPPFAQSCLSVELTKNGNVLSVSTKPLKNLWGLSLLGCFPDRITMSKYPKQG